MSVCRQSLCQMNQLRVVDMQASYKSHWLNKRRNKTLCGRRKSETRVFDSKSPGSVSCLRCRRILMNMGLLDKE